MPTTGDPTYLAELERDRQLHIAKAAGYTGSDPDTWANFREAIKWGTTPLQGCLIRMGDKYRRLQSLNENPAHDQVGESFLDTLRDLGAYARIAVCLYLEEQAAVEASKPVDGLEAKVEAVFESLSFGPEEEGPPRLGLGPPPRACPYTAYVGSAFWHQEGPISCSLYEAHRHGSIISSDYPVVIFP